MHLTLAVLFGRGNLFRQQSLIEVPNFSEAFVRAYPPTYNSQKLLSNHVHNDMILKRVRRSLPASIQV